jgi:hypothetical protein
MKHKNETIRKASFLVLIDLLYNNEVLQNIFCEKYNFNPIGNVICINWLPPVFKEKIAIDTSLIIELKKSSSNCITNTKYWKWPNNPKYTDDLIPDPERYLVGFFYSSKVIINSKSEASGTGYDVQKVIELLEEGYEATPLNIINDNNNVNTKIKGEGQKLKEEYKKSKIKNPSRSIDFKQMGNNDKIIKNKK